MNKTLILAGLSVLLFSGCAQRAKKGDTYAHGEYDFYKVLLEKVNPDKCLTNQISALENSLGDEDARKNIETCWSTSNSPSIRSTPECINREHWTIGELSSGSWHVVDKRSVSEADDGHIVFNDSDAPCLRLLHRIKDLEAAVEE